MRFSQVLKVTLLVILLGAVIVMFMPTVAEARVSRPVFARNPYMAGVASGPRVTGPKITAWKYTGPRVSRLQKVSPATRSCAMNASWSSSSKPLNQNKGFNRAWPATSRP